MSLKRDGYSVIKKEREERISAELMNAANKAGMTKTNLSDAFIEEGLMGVYKLGMKHMYEYLMEDRS